MRTGGRTATFTHEDVVAAGVRLGLRDLTVQAVADALGVTTAAVYRHVPSRAALETLVGEAVLAGLTLEDDPAQPVADHLVAFAWQLRRFTKRHPGSGPYLQRIFPRGPSGVRLLETQIRALGRRGYDPAAATVLSSAVATVTLGLTVVEEVQEAHALLDPPGTEQATREARAAMAASPLVVAAVGGIPAHTADDYFDVVVSALADGLVRRLPPGAAVAVLREDH
ncbi:TetR/AcrR family transcriptional regulator [Nonomuraea typhae]|uniref:TetR/AcrR family transcriptional regulator n=1 Tax=Nonomuraea typhae TaxID=2603600 RepID=UPI0012FB5E42|nr:TetR family transcriptional regulator [Nonomuraea typhae]